jgi:hypothetical protein
MSQNPRRSRQVAQSILQDINVDGTRTSGGRMDHGTLPQYTVLSLFLRHRVVKVSHRCSQTCGLAAGRMGSPALPLRLLRTPERSRVVGTALPEGHTGFRIGARSWRCCPCSSPSGHAMPYSTMASRACSVPRRMCTKASCRRCVKHKRVCGATPGDGYAHRQTRSGDSGDAPLSWRASGRAPALWVRALQQGEGVRLFRRYSKADKSCDMLVSRSVPEDCEPLWCRGSAIPYFPQLHWCVRVLW